MTAEELVRLEQACFPDAATHWKASDFNNHLTNPYGITIGAVNGYATGQIAAGEAELISIGVLPDARGKGVGADLLKQFVAEATRRGAHSVFLEVAETNTAARMLYTKAGFQKVGHRRGYYKRPDGSQVDALILRKRAEG